MLAASCAWGVSAQASDLAPAQAPPGPPQAGAAADGDKGLWQRDKLFGDIGGLRTRLEDAGVVFTLQEQSEVLGNVAGGVRRGAIYEGATLMGLAIDTGKIIGLPGGAFNASAYQIHGLGLSARDLHNLNVVSGIEAPRSTRLFELWYEQTLMGGKASVRVGQLAADQEFIISQYGALFINSGVGWPTLAAIDLPSGGPAYPLATPGIRLRATPTDRLSVLAGVYNGDPADNGSGTSFEVNRGVFAIGEIQYAINHGANDAGLPGTYKAGAWFNSNRFADQRFGIDGLSLANPASSGEPRQHRGDWSVYGLADQMIYRRSGTADQGIGVFARIMGAPGDRNEVAFFANGGLAYKGILPGRPDDSAGVGVAYARISDRASALDADRAFFSGSLFPIRSGETALELTYQAQLSPWWSLQPDVQYVFSPGGNIPDPQHPTRPIGDAAIFGLRTALTF